MYVSTQPLHHKQNVTQGQYLSRVCIYPTPSPQTKCDTGQYLSRVLSTQPLHHTQNVTQGQYLSRVLSTQPLHHTQNVTQGQYLSRVCSYPTPSPHTKCDTGSIFK